MILSLIGTVGPSPPQVPPPPYVHDKYGSELMAGDWVRFEDEVYKVRAVDVNAKKVDIGHHPATTSSAAAAVAAEGSGASASSAAQTAQAGRKVSFWFFNLVYDGYLRITLEHDGLVRRVDHGAAAPRLLAVPEDVRQLRRVLFL